MTVMTACLKDVEVKNGVLTEWNPVSVRRIMGLPEYLWESGLWRFIAAATDMNPSLRVKEADYEGVDCERLPRESADVIVFEAKKTDDAHDRLAPCAQGGIQNTKGPL